MAIKVSGTTVIDDDRNINNVGIFTSTAFSGSGANFTNIPEPSPKPNTFQATASGTLSDGSTVVLNSDGTVSTVTGSDNYYVTSNNTRAEGSAVAFDSSNNKFVIVYRDQNNSNRGTAVVATVSGSEISFGTPVIFESGGITYPGITFDSTANRVVITYNESAIVGQVSGTSITFGPVNQFGSGSLGYCYPIYDSNSNKTIVIFRDTANSDFGSAIVGTVTGGATNSISFGSPVVYNSILSDRHSATIDTSTNRLVIAFLTGDTLVQCIVGEISGTTINFGSIVTVDSDTDCGVTPSVTFDSNVNRVVIFYGANTSNVTDPIPVYTKVGTVTGGATNSISFGSRSPQIALSSLESGISRILNVIFNPNDNTILLLYPLFDSWNLTFVDIPQVGNATIGTVTGGATNTVSIASTSVFASYDNYVYGGISSAIDVSSNKILITHFDGPPNFTIGDQFATVYAPTNVDKFIGFSDGSYTDGQTATIQIAGGINDTQTGLTTASKYYVKRTGILTTESYINGSSVGSRISAGTAISSNQIIIG